MPLTSSLKPMNGRPANQAPGQLSVAQLQLDIRACKLNGPEKIKILSVVYIYIDSRNSTYCSGISTEPEAKGPRIWGSLPRGPRYPRGPSRFKRASLHLYSWPHAGSLREVLPIPHSLTRWDYWSLPPILNQFLTISRPRSGECGLHSQKFTPEFTLMLRALQITCVSSSR